jgi:hypothetical protein
MRPHPAISGIPGSSVRTWVGAPQTTDKDVGSARLPAAAWTRAHPAAACPPNESSEEIDISLSANAQHIILFINS